MTMRIPNEILDALADDRYREATKNLNSTIIVIHDTLAKSRPEKERSMAMDNLSSLFIKLSKQLLEYKILYNQLIVNSEEDTSDYSCAKDTIEAFNKSIYHINENIKKLQDYTSKNNLLAEKEINYINGQMEKITKNLKSLEQISTDLSFCTYYDDVESGT